ncbi:DUF4405 domain-containing protein [Neobacillus endophyticus]|uniref:DUF4405 domain-containing protein n=1 Tax=Neobacillus endophyticus TaxID=2738405 RepID=UPI001FEC5DC1|nr:DUF4405 domain-containing protein [Neobacillus endophyticus]
MYFTHILLNWKWVANVTRKLFDPKLPWRTRGSYALNLLLLISMSFVIISGILISKVVFPNIHVTNQMWFHVTHIAVSFLVLLLVGIHVGLHWQWIVNVWRKIWRVKSSAAWGRYAARALTVLVLLFGVYEINSTNFVNQLSGVSSVFGMSTQNMAGHNDGDFHKPMDGMKPFDGNMPANSTTKSNQQNGQANSNAAQDFRANIKHDGEGGGGSVNVFGVISTYTGIMALFVIITYYLKKLFGRKKKKDKSN